MTILELNRKAKARKIYSRIAPLAIAVFRALPFSAWLVLAGAVFFVWFWVFGSKGLYELEQLRGLKQERLEEKAKLLEEKTRLEQELQYLKDPEYQQHIIRRELGYIKEDEAVIQFHPKKQ